MADTKAQKEKKKQKRLLQAFQQYKKQKGTLLLDLGGSFDGDLSEFEKFLKYKATMERLKP